jgi:CRP-like cAMP-binding protein
VKSGALHVSLESNGQTYRLGQKRAGDWVGEMGLVLPGPASATVSAEGTTEVEVLTRDRYVERRDEHALAAGVLLTHIACDLARRIRRSSEVSVEEGEGGKWVKPVLRALEGVDRKAVDIPSWDLYEGPGRPAKTSRADIVKALDEAGVFRPLTAADEAYAHTLRADFTLLAPTLLPRILEDGHVLLREGDKADALHVVLRGGIRVRAGRPGSRFGVDRVLGPGELVGLIAFFDDGTRSATCTAYGETEVAAVYPAAVKELLFQGEHGVAMGLHVLDFLVRQLVRDARALNDGLVHALPAGEKA